MRYLYGDSSPFPLDENFLETLTELTDTLVAVLKIEETTQQARKDLQRVERNTSATKRWFAELGQTLIQTIESRIDVAGSALPIKDAPRLVTCTQGLLNELQQVNLTLLHRSKETLLSSVAQQMERVAPILERFFLRHQLPQSAWGLKWRGPRATKRPSTAEAVCSMDQGFEATFDLDLPPSSRWARGIRAGNLIPKIPLVLPRTDGRLKLKKIQLANFYLTEAVLSPTCQMLTFGRYQRPDAVGYCIKRTLKNDGLEIQPLVQGSQNTFQLSGARSTPLLELFRLVDRELSPLIALRRRMRAASLGNVALGELASLSELVKLLINAAAPVVHDLILRSPTSNEIAIKSIVDQTRRVEFYLPMELLAKRIAVLSPQYQALFGAFGFGRSTLDSLVADELAGETEALVSVSRRAAAPITGPKIIIEPTLYLRQADATG